MRQNLSASMRSPSSGAGTEPSRSVSPSFTKEAASPPRGSAIKQFVSGTIGAHINFSIPSPKPLSPGPLTGPASTTDWNRFECQPNLIKGGPASHLVEDAQQADESALPQEPREPHLSSDFAKLHTIFDGIPPPETSPPAHLTYKKAESSLPSTQVVQHDYILQDEAVLFLFSFWVQSVMIK